MRRDLCDRHQLALADDGRCVLCRRHDPPERRGATGWWLLPAAALAGLLAWQYSREPLQVASAPGYLLDEGVAAMAAEQPSEPMMDEPMVAEPPRPIRRIEADRFEPPPRTDRETTLAITRSEDTPAEPPEEARAEPTAAPPVVAVTPPPKRAIVVVVSQNAPPSVPPIPSQQGLRHSGGRGSWTGWRPRPTPHPHSMELWGKTSQAPRSQTPARRASTRAQRTRSRSSRLQSRRPRARRARPARSTRARRPLRTRSVRRR